MYMNINKIKYYPDKFYICLDGFDLDNLGTFTSDVTFSQQQAIYIHEYYHYLTNITTFAGLREFNLVFQDKIRIITRLSAQAYLNAYPIKDNDSEDCRNDIEYWKDTVDIVDSEDINYKLAEEVENSIDKKFKIVSLNKVVIPMQCVVRDNLYKGRRIIYEINIDGLLLTNKFKLSIAVLDEFLSSSIDEFMFQHDLADNCDVIRNRPFYPYGLFDELLKYYNIGFLDSLHKIMIVYCSLHSSNPTVAFVNILEEISNDSDSFITNPEQFLLALADQSYGNQLFQIIKYEEAFIKECEQQGRYNLRDTVYLLYKKSCIAYNHLKVDSFYFIRPFMVQNIKNGDGRMKLLNLFETIKIEMDEPLILKNKMLIDGNTDTYKNHLAMLIAIYEIMDSLYVNRIARRTVRNKERFSYPVEATDDDLIENIPNTCPLTHTWHVALNELGLYGEYLKLKRSLPPYSTSTAK